MKYWTLFLLILSLNCKTKTSGNQADSTVAVTDKTATTASNVGLESGFYLALLDSSKKEGYKVLDKDEFYFLDTAAIVTFKGIDSVYKEYNRHTKYWMLIFKFDNSTSEKWFGFTKKYQGFKVALVAHEKLIYVATIGSPISDGATTLAGAYNEQQIDDLKNLFEQEIRKAKNFR